MRNTGDYSVVIAGGGPTGLMLAGELALGGVNVVIVERRRDQRLDGSRAGGLHSRTIEMLDQRGIAGRFLSEGETHPFVGYAGTTLSISDFPTRHNYLLALWQSKFQPILADWVGELGVPITRDCEVVGLAQDGAGVDVAYLITGHCGLSTSLVAMGDEARSERRQESAFPVGMPRAVG